MGYNGAIGERAGGKMNELIMAVHQDEYMRNAICDVFGGYSYDMALAVDGLGLLNLLPKLKRLPQAVVWGVIQPQLDDYGYVRSIRQKPPFDDIPFIFLLNQGDSRMSPLENGLNRYLWKPFSPYEILNAVREVVK